VIERHVDWLVERLAAAGLRPPPQAAGDAPPSRSGRLLDVACGPGLYCHALSRRGWPCVGVDFAPAPIAYARRIAAAERLPCEFLLADLTELPADFATRVGEFAAVAFWSGEFHALARDAAAALVATLAARIAAGGLFVLEYQPWESFPRDEEQAWKICDRSPFRDGRQLWLQEWAWDEDARAVVDVHWVLTAADAHLERFVQRHFAYRESELDELFADAGLRIIERRPPVTGADPDFEFPLLVAAKI
jgi:SAM-dependent methyltransferase